MKRFIVLGLTISLLVLNLPFVIFPLEDIQANEENIDEDEDLDQQANSPEGIKRVHSKLKDKFNVTEQQIHDLRNQDMGYGEINKAFALAEQLEGGLTNDNLQRVLNLRHQEEKGWGEVAGELNLQLGDVVSQSNKKTGVQEPESASVSSAGSVSHQQSMSPTSSIKPKGKPSAIPKIEKPKVSVPKTISRPPKPPRPSRAKGGN